MAEPVPPVIRALVAIDRVVQWVAKGELLLRDELIFALVPLERRDAVSHAIYARHRGYRPGGALFDGGLQPWEAALLERRPFPDGGTILVGGAGGGREVTALEARGFRVVAFEPNDVLFESLRTVCARAFRGSYDDLVRAVERGEGPLAEVIAAAPFDGVLFGWSSLAHVIDEDARIRALAAARSLSDGAAVISFITDAPYGPRAARVAATLRRLLGGRARPGERFFPGGGFVRSIDREELARVAEAAGYRVELFHREPLAHALLTAITAASGRAGPEAAARSPASGGGPDPE